MKTFFIKWKGIWTKNIESNRVSIWVEVFSRDGIELIQRQSDTFKATIGDKQFDTWIWDSTTPIRATNDDKMIAQIEINIPLPLVGLILVSESIIIN